MLSARGALSTNVAMVECAAGQNTSSRALFLLSELEAVWVAVSLVMRHHLLEGRAVQIPHFGTFALVEAHLFTDKVHRTRYFVRQLQFRVNPRFATTYNIDTVHYAVEKPTASSTRLPWAEVVQACGVPAQTAATALKEFFLYIGEALFRKRLIQLTFPGVAALVLKRERLMLTPDWEFQSALFEIDAYRWPADMKAHGRARLEERLGNGVADDSRPSSSASRVSWRPSVASAEEGSHGVTAPRKTFVAAAPAGRLFSDIEKETQRQRQMRAIEKADAEAAAHRERDVAKRLERYHDCYRFDSLREAEVHRPVSRPSTSESIYRWVEATQTIERATASREAAEAAEAAEEPEIEAIEVVAVSEHAAETDGVEAEADAAPYSFEPRPMTGKDTELERLLREEEPFSRPMSRKSCAQPSAARDLIYGTATAETRARVVPASTDGPVAVSIARPSPAPPVSAPAPAADAPPLRFGRKRYDYGMEPQTDSVGALLKRSD